MTSLYAGWAPGEALNFGWQLGVTASHSDLLDYRAMLAREWLKKSRDEFEHQAREDRLYKDMVRS